MFKMTSCLIKNILNGPATRQHPAAPRPPFAGVRGMLVNTIEKCTFCGVCAATCPCDCIRVDKKTAVWAYDPFRCVYCGTCVENCRFQALHQESAYLPPSLARRCIQRKGTVPDAHQKETSPDSTD